MSISLSLNEKKAKRLQDMVHEAWPELAEEIRSERLRDLVFEAVLALYSDDSRYPQDNPTPEDVEEFRGHAIEAVKPFRVYFDPCGACEYTGVTVKAFSDSPHWEEYGDSGRNVDEVDFDICDCVKEPLSSFK